MKRIIAALLFLAGVTQLQAQNYRIGFRFAPDLSFTLVHQYKYAYPGVKQKGVGVRMSLGPTVDYFFTKNIAASSGLWYTVRSVNLYMGSLYNRPNDPNSKYYSKSRYNVTYLQIPVTGKIYTNIMIKKMAKLYFQGGGTIDIKLAEKAKDTGLSYGSNNYLYNTANIPSYNNDGKVFRTFNLGYYLGVGAEKSLGKNKAVFASVSFSKGLIQMLRHLNDRDDNGVLNDISKTLHVQTSQLSFEIGMKFL